MDVNFIVRTEAGRSDSLKESVQLFFTLAPIVSNRSVRSYYPSGYGPVQFEAGVDRSAELSWGSELSFCSYDFVGTHQKGAKFYNSSPVLSPGQSITMAPSANAKPLWVANNTHPMLKQSAVVAINNTGQSQRLGLCIHSLNTQKTTATVFYDPLEDGEHLAAPSDLVLQAYIIEPSETIGKVLRPEDLNRPLFPIPLSRNALPASSTWRLIQNGNGEIKLVEIGLAELENHSIETLTKSMYDMHDRLSLVFKTLDDTQKRLSTFEDSLNDNRTQLAITRDDLAVARAKLSTLDQAIPMAETKHAGLKASFAQMHGRLNLMETSITTAHEGIASGKRDLGYVCTQLSAMEKASTTTKGALFAIQESCITTQHRISTLDEKVPALEGKLSELGAAFGSSEKRISATGSSLTAHKNRLFDPADRQIPQLEAKPKELEKSHSSDELSIKQNSVDLARHDPSALDRRVLTMETGGHNLVEPAQAGQSFAMDSTATTQGFDRDVPSVEAKVAELEKSVDGTKKDIALMRKLLRTRLPALESKAEALEASVVQVQEGLSGVRSSFASSVGQMAGLDMRVIAVEDALRGIRAGQHSSRSPRSNSPLLFPNRRPESRTASPSREAAFFNREDSDSDFGG